MILLTNKAAELGYYQFGYLYRKSSFLRRGTMAKTPHIICASRLNAAGYFKCSIDDSRLKYIGPANVFSPLFEMENMPNWYRQYFNDMIEVAHDGHENVRFSKKTGLPIFSCDFPRYRKNGEWWPSEHQYLSMDRDLADEQIKFSGI